MKLSHHIMEGLRLMKGYVERKYHPTSVKNIDIPFDALHTKESTLKRLWIKLGDLRMGVINIAYRPNFFGENIKFV